MNTTFLSRLSMFAGILLAGWACAAARAETGVLLLAHGSPDPAWNRPVLDFGKQVAATLQGHASVQAVRTALMESATPDAVTAIEELEAAGCKRIVAVPLFVAPSGHTHFDVPAVLGVFSSPRTTAQLRQEGGRTARPHVPVVVTQTLSEGRLLEEYALQQVRKLSQASADEALVLLAHGDPEHELLVDRKMREVASYCCGQAGISYADWAYIGVGQEYAHAGLPVIRRALEARKRVVVVGLYLSLSAANIHQRHGTAARHGGRTADPLAGKDVVFSKEPLLAHPGLPTWIAEAAHAAVAYDGSAAKAHPARDGQ